MGRKECGGWCLDRRRRGKALQTIQYPLYLFHYCFIHNGRKEKIKEEGAKQNSLLYNIRNTFRYNLIQGNEYKKTIERRRNFVTKNVKIFA